MDTTISISWEPPCDNNIPISSYKVYRGIMKITDAKQQAKIFWDHVDTVDHFNDDPFFGAKCTLTGLEPDTCYYVKIAAINERGEEGYHSTEPFFVKTMTNKISHCDSLFSWGYNARNEIGIPDEVIDANSADFVNGAMTKPVRSPMFDGIVYQIAPGNVSTLFLCANAESKDTFLVTCGVCFAPNEGCD